MSRPTAVPGLATSGGPLAERLQELLEQAVQDQLAERALVAKTLTELGDRLAATSAAALTGQSELAGRVVTATTELRQAQAELGDRVAGTGRSLHESLAGLGDQVEAAAFAGRVVHTELTRSVSEELGLHGVSVARLAGALDPVPEALDRLRADVAELAQRVDALAAAMGAGEGYRSGPVPGVSESGDGAARLADRLAVVLAPALEAALREHVAQESDTLRQPVPDRSRRWWQSSGR